LDNVLATPHIGYVAETLYRTFYGDAAASIAAWLDEIADSNRGKPSKLPPPKQLDQEPT
jgi:phosphoglycerate dehydrogenase-like enzyme